MSFELSSLDKMFYSKDPRNASLTDFILTPKFPSFTRVGIGKAENKTAESLEHFNMLRVIWGLLGYNIIELIIRRCRAATCTTALGRHSQTTISLRISKLEKGK